MEIERLQAAVAAYARLGGPLAANTDCTRAGSSITPSRGCWPARGSPLADLGALQRPRLVLVGGRLVAHGG